MARSTPCDPPAKSTTPPPRPEIGSQLGVNGGRAGGVFPPVRPATGSLRRVVEGRVAHTGVGAVRRPQNAKE
eukprot:scaffold23057_cov73-Isochrysis_galbana.AAC.1